MKSLPLRALLILATGLLLGGCASYDGSVEPGRSVAKMQRFFVLSNLNDNHGLDHQLVESLKAHGRTADAGPLTMMPDDTQVVVLYQDRWTWDFGDHLIYLQVAVRDTRSEQPFATVSFSAKVPTSKTPAAIVDSLVDKLLKK
jgi:hypothetical protein